MADWQVFQAVEKAVQETIDNGTPEYRTALDVTTKLIREAYSEAGLKDGSASSIKFSNVAFRWAYVYRYVTSHTYMVLKALNKFWEINFDLNSWVDNLHDSGLRVCCVGGGPGSDLIGIALFVKQQQLGVSSIHGDILDEWPQWKDMYCTVAKRMDPGYLMLPSKKNVNYRHFNFNQTYSWMPQLQVIQDADLVTMVKFVSAVASNPSMCQAHLTVLLHYMKSGAMLFVLDNARKEVFDIVAQAATAAGLRQISEVHFKKGLQLPQGEKSAIDASTLRLADVKPQKSSVVSAVLWQKGTSKKTSRGLKIKNGLLPQSQPCVDETSLLKEELMCILKGKKKKTASNECQSTSSLLCQTGVSDKKTTSLPQKDILDKQISSSESVARNSDLSAAVQVAVSAPIPIAQPQKLTAMAEVKSILTTPTPIVPLKDSTPIRAITNLAPTVTRISVTPTSTNANSTPISATPPSAKVKPVTIGTTPISTNTNPMQIANKINVTPKSTDTNYTFFPQTSTSPTCIPNKGNLVLPTASNTNPTSQPQPPKMATNSESTKGTKKGKKKTKQKVNIPGLAQTAAPTKTSTCKIASSPTLKSLPQSKLPEAKSKVKKKKTKTASTMTLNSFVSTKTQSTQTNSFDSFWTQMHELWQQTEASKSATVEMANVGVQVIAFDSFLANIHKLWEQSRQSDNSTASTTESSSVSVSQTLDAACEQNTKEDKLVHPTNCITFPNPSFCHELKKDKVVAPTCDTTNTSQTLTVSAADAKTATIRSSRFVASSDSNFIHKNKDEQVDELVLFSLHTSSLSYEPTCVNLHDQMKDGKQKTKTEQRSTLEPSAAKETGNEVRERSQSPQKRFSDRSMSLSHTREDFAESNGLSLHLGAHYPGQAGFPTAFDSDEFWRTGCDETIYTPDTSNTGLLLGLAGISLLALIAFRHYFHT